jgi:hypothetical protein
MPSQTACQEQGEERSIPLSLDALVVGCLPECLALFGCQPVAKAHAQFFDAFDTANTGRKAGTKQAAASGLICKSAYGPQSEPDGA